MHNLQWARFGLCSLVLSALMPLDFLSCVGVQNEAQILMIKFEATV